MVVEGFPQDGDSIQGGLELEHSCIKVVVQGDELGSVLLKVALYPFG